MPNKIKDTFNIMIPGFKNGPKPFGWPATQHKGGETHDRKKKYSRQYYHIHGAAAASYGFLQPYHPPQLINYYRKELLQ